MKNSDNTKGIISLVFLAFVFASMGLFARYLSTGLGLFQQVYLRILAAFLIGLIAFKKNLNFSKLQKISSKEWKVLLFRAATFYLIGVTTFTLSLTLTKYSSVSFIGALPLSAVFGALLLKEKLTFKKVLALLLAMVGVILISVKDYSTLLVFGRGEIIALISSVSFSLSYISRRWQTKLLNNQEISLITFALGFIMVFLASVLKGDSLPLTGWHWGLVLAVIGAEFFNILNQFFVNYGFEKVKAILASNILTLEMLFAVILGFTFYQELPNFKELFGGLMIVSGIIWMNYLENHTLKV